MNDQKIAFPDTLPFAELAVTDPEEFQRIAERFEYILWESFGQDAIATGRPTPPTLRETRRRFKICERWIRILRGDLKYSWAKTIDLLPVALRCELEGVTWTPPPADQGWVVPGNTKPMEADTTVNLAKDEDS